MACTLTSDLYVSIILKRLIHILPNVNKRQVNIVLKYLDVMSAFLISLLDPYILRSPDGHLNVSNCKMVLVLPVTAALELVN